ncbi:MAG: type II toxin-antitoxin system RatA family toxin, partial [Alphaproteobacteria bacterium]|nr:type II toxin-antitoxin system RatA family toxin [Alphaproteobacteria bacterium]
WCLAARILKQGDSRLEAELVIGFKGIKERFVSIVDLDRATYRIDVTYQEGPFKFLENHWHFLPQDSNSCLLDFNVEFEFRSRVLQTLIGPLFNEAVRRMVHAFETRAENLCGAQAGNADANSHSPA